MTHGGSEGSGLPPLRPAAALREALGEGYGARQLRSDAAAGVVVGIVALPLSMALAIAAGVPPQHGLYTAIVAGAAIALLGGSRTLVSGPTAAFVAILAPISAKYGLGGLVLASLMAGVILVALGVARLGRLIQFVPNPVTTGFTAGIGLVIATFQVKDFLGLSANLTAEEHYLGKVRVLVEALPTARWPEIAIGTLTLVLLGVWPWVSHRIPAQVMALTAAAVAAWALERWGPGVSVDTIASRFSYSFGGATHPGIPQLPPLPVLPWHLPGAGGAPVGLSFAMLRELLPSAFAIAMLGAIESLLAAVVSDAMAGTTHDPDAELVAQGTGNLLAPFFGGFAATGAIARTAANVHAGGRSPISAVVHSVFLLAAVLALAPLLGRLPMAGLSAVLVMVAWKMSDVHYFVRAFRTSPRSDVLVLLTCFVLTVVFDMVVAVTVGIVLASLLFMRRMAEITGSRAADPTEPTPHGPLPPGVLLYEISGPMFFGAAQKAVRALDRTPGEISIVLLDVERVPVMDASGLVSLTSALDRLEEQRRYVILAGLNPQPSRVAERGGITARRGLEIVPTLEEAVRRAWERAKGSDTPRA